MTSRPSMAQRLGRILEALTHQSGRLASSSTCPASTSSASFSAYGSLLLGKISENPRRRRIRLQSILTVAVLLLNVIGIAVAALLVIVAFPVPNVFHDAPHWLTFVVSPAYTVATISVGIWWITTHTVRDLRWAIVGLQPTRADQRNTFLTPWRIAMAHLVLWAAASTTFTIAYGIYDSEFVPQLALGIGFCGILVATSAYMASEFVLRPVAAQALAAGQPPHRLAPGIMGRTMTVWMLGSGVPVIGIGLTALFSLQLQNLSKTQLEIAILIITVATLIFGFTLMWVLAWLTATPVRVVRAALKRVENGDLTTNLVVFDGTELGELQRGFNTMVNGLREREQVRDLFGRHVGREVAAAAERQNITLGGHKILGGHERHAAIVFVDIMGSTQLVSELEPVRLVDLLNEFFTVIVDEVNYHHGLVNKFAGDATLAVFGAPVALENPETAALAAGRAIAERLRREVPDCPAGIGIASGQVAAGNVGAHERFEYTVIGDPVHEAARLSEVAKLLPQRILTTADTVSCASAQEQMQWRRGELITLRGYSHPTRIATVVKTHGV